MSLERKPKKGKDKKEKKGGGLVEKKYSLPDVRALCDGISNWTGKVPGGVKWSRHHDNQLGDFVLLFCDRLRPFHAPLGGDRSVLIDETHAS